jgi:hypothetical protein
MRLRPRVAWTLAQAIPAGNETDPHCGARRGAADAQPRQGGYMYGPQDGTTDPNPGPLSRRPQVPC